MKQYKPEDIRNVGLVGHGGSGKTSVAEAILYISGVNDRLGKVGDASSVMDYDPDEVERGSSVSASVAFYESGKDKVNLIDAPGDSNFIADTPACLRVVDGAVIVVSAVDGVQFYTEKDGIVKVKIYNILGHHINSIASGHRPSGVYETSWNGYSRTGRIASNGVYVAVLYIDSKKFDAVKMVKF